MAASYREQITGFALRDPEVFNDLPIDIQVAYVADLELLVSKLSAAAKLVRAQSDTPKVTITFQQNPNLFSLAAMLYGDVNSWSVLANSSDLANPVYTGQVEVRVPPANAVSNLTLNKGGG